MSIVPKLRNTEVKFCYSKINLYVRILLRDKYVNKSTYIKVNCFSQQVICKAVNNIRKDEHKIKTRGLGLEVWVVLRFHVWGRLAGYSKNPLKSNLKTPKDEDETPKRTKASKAELGLIPHFA